MSALTIEGWCKVNGEQKSTPMGEIHFYVDGPLHLGLEQAEERLQKTHEREAMVDVDMEHTGIDPARGIRPFVRLPNARLYTQRARSVPFGRASSE